jgi:hypothetical protein
VRPGLGRAIPAILVIGVTGATLARDIAMRDVSGPGESKRMPDAACNLFSNAVTLLDKIWSREKTLLTTRYTPDVGGAWTPNDAFSSANSAFKFDNAAESSRILSSASYH